MNQSNQTKPKQKSPLWAKIFIGIAFTIGIISFVSHHPELRKTAGAILLLVGVIGFLWSGIWLLIDLFSTAHDKIVGSTLYKFLTPARRRYFLFFIVSIIIGFIGSALS